MHGLFVRSGAGEGDFAHAGERNEREEQLRESGQRTGVGGSAALAPRRRRSSGE